jgi:hypothetical protein
MNAFEITVMALFLIRIIARLTYLEKNEYPRLISRSVDLWSLVIALSLFVWGLCRI